MNCVYLPRIFRKRDEEGVVLVLVAMFIAVLLGFAALVTDIPLQELNVRELQNAADAAAHAMAVRLDGTKQGWLDAKRAGFRVLKDSSLHAKFKQLNAPLDRPLSLDLNHDGTDETFALADPYETNPRYRYNIGTQDDLVVILDRGMLLHNKFERWEDLTTRQIKGTALEHRVYQLAHAARVEIRVSNVRTTFGRIFGHDVLPEVKVTAVAAYDQFEKVEVAPLAIPACQLRFDPDHYKVPLAEPDTRQQCHRDIIFAEAKYRNPLRRQGIYRHQLYNSSILVPVPGESFKTLSFNFPLVGTIGVFDDEPADLRPDESDDMKGAANIQELVDYLAQGGASGSKQVKLGYSFKPLVWGSQSMCSSLGGHSDDCSDAAGHLEAPYNQQLGDILSSIMNGASGSPRYADQYGTCSQTITSRSDCPAFPTFPYPRLSAAEGGALGWMWIPGQAPQTYTNPLCHDQAQRITANDPERRMKKVRIALIAPSEPSYKYCSWSEGDGAWSLPLPKTKPVVVGTIEATLIDFNLDSLQDERLNPRDRAPAGWLYGDGYVPPDCMNTPMTFVNAMVSNFERMMGLPAGGAGIDTTAKYCAVLPQIHAMLTAVGNPGLAPPPSSFTGTSCTTSLPTPDDPSHQPNKGNLPSAHCFPVCDNVDAQQCGTTQLWWDWEPQYGCGGIQSRLTCDDKSIPSQNARVRKEPIIIYRE